MSNQMYTTHKSLRWYGDHDVVNLTDIRQTGCEGVVTALHYIPVGEIWEESEINYRKSEIEKHKLNWKVVESLPVHEEIKLRSGKFEEYIDNYKISIENLAKQGIEVVTYNFMPVFDWLRTSTDYKLSNGSRALRFNKSHYTLFDLFILKRKGAEKDYTEAEIANAKQTFKKMSEKRKRKLINALMQGLPGSTVPFTVRGIHEALNQYKGYDAETLRKNLELFLQEVVPVAEHFKIRLAIHPDDPPFPVFGLPRIVCNENDAAFILDSIDSIYNGLCFCTGSYGANPNNDLVQMFRRFGSRINFLHLRSTSRNPDTGTFYESEHLRGDADMYGIMREAILLMQKEQRSIPMRPDHGLQMLDDLHKKTIPGYSLIGRMKGLAELTGLEYGLIKELESSS